MSCYVNTVRGPIDVNELGTTLMHEHLAELNNSMKRCYAVGSMLISSWRKSSLSFKKQKNTG